MILVIDNFDFFTHNIVGYYKKKGFDVLVKRNDEISLKQLLVLDFSHLVVCAGPKTSKGFPILMEIIDYFKDKKPILGVCLGFQSIGQYFGLKIVKAQKVAHGRLSNIYHEGQGVFRGLPVPIRQTRYHSFIVENKDAPNFLEITALNEEGEIMAFRHKTYPLEAIQFHPESILSEKGEDILDNFVSSKETSVDSIDYEEGAKELSASFLKLTRGEDLSRKEAFRLMEGFKEEKTAKEMASALLVALSYKKLTSEEVSGFVESMLESCLPFGQTSGAIDIVGTGGDSSGTFNISSASSFVAAGCGLPVVKHGNRAVSSKSGSADVLEVLGIKIDCAASFMEESLEKNKIAFLFAPLYHPSMREVGKVRKILKIKTLFNFLGPLVNPARVKRILLGVYSKDLMDLAAETLLALNYEKAMVVHSKDGLDEISLCDETFVVEIDKKKKINYCLDPTQLGLSFCKRSEIEGGGPMLNSRIVLDVLEGRENGAKKDIILLNSGAALYVGGCAKSILEGVQMAKRSISEGRALSCLKGFRQTTNQ